MLSRSQTCSQTCSELEFGLSRTIYLASSELARARELVAEQLRHVEVVRTCLRQVGNQVCDQLASWSQNC